MVIQETAQRPAQILIADDNPMMGQIVVSALDAEGYRAAVVEGHDLVATALDAPPRLILLDVLMPACDGPTLCRRLRANPRTSSVPLVLVTGLPQTALDELLRGCPYDEVLAKPFDLDDLLRVVERHAGPPPPEQ